MQHSRNLRSCEAYGKRIPPERLRFDPACRRCVRCSDARKVTDAEVACDGAATIEDRVDSANGGVDRGGDWS